MSVGDARSAACGEGWGWSAWWAARVMAWKVWASSGGSLVVTSNTWPWMMSEAVEKSMKTRILGGR